jgi:hypothetical protein
MSTGGKETDINNSPIISLHLIEYEAIYYGFCPPKTVNNWSGFLDAQNANLFVMYVKTRFQIKFELTKSYTVPIFYLIISSGSMFDLIQLVNLISKSITSPKLLTWKLPLTTSPNEL